MNCGKVYLVGAGCGASDLITVKGLRLLSSCDAVIYDDLIDIELLNNVPEAAEKIYMGKRNGKHSAPQHEISEKIIEKALEGKNVVRLKGGDPFVFGRGGEEIEAVKAAGIPFDIVPGISSSIAIPAAAGIPVTHRGISRSFHVFTAHTADSGDGLPENIEEMAKLSGTLVFLMGLSKLSAITERLIAGGMSKDTPAAVISGGNSSNPYTVRSTLQSIAGACDAAGATPPAVIVIGQTAGLDMTPTIFLPLKGYKIAITGTDTMYSRLYRKLTELGAEAFQAQRSIVDNLSDSIDLEKIINRSCTVVFTSSNGVRLFFERLLAQNIDHRRLSKCSFAVIGSSTGSELAKHGIVPDYCPDIYTSEELAKKLISSVEPGSPVYLFRSAKGSPELAEDLSNYFEVHDLIAYDIHSDSLISAQSEEKLNDSDFICFSSAGGVNEFFKEHGSLPAKAKCVCIGSVTSQALEKHSIKEFITAEEISSEGIIKAILDNL